MRVAGLVAGPQPQAQPVRCQGPSQGPASTARLNSAPRLGRPGQAQGQGSCRHPWRLPQAPTATAAATTRRPGRLQSPMALAPNSGKCPGCPPPPRPTPVHLTHGLLAAVWAPGLCPPAFLTPGVCLALPALLHVSWPLCPHSCHWVPVSWETVL